ncbi:MAG TPA: ATP synthase F1 subunit gamma [Longimicrobiales bacterium]
MAKVREIRRRIRSVENTRQITRTMEMVATSKLKRATDRVHAARPYAERLAQVIGRLADPELRERFPLLRRPQQVRRAAVLVLTANRGWAGAFNANLIREGRLRLESLREAGVDVELHVVGKKGINAFRFRGEAMASERTDISDRPSADDAASLVDPLIAAFERGDLDAVHVVYAQFRSALSTPPATLQVLPVEPPEEAAGAQPLNYILSPSADEILGKLLPLYVRNSIYRALVETAAAEQGARRTAMKSATDNAGEMLDGLRRSYNRARQAQITQEISEIVGGAAALE